jgi:hypothetical protein
LLYGNTKTKTYRRITSVVMCAEWLRRPKLSNNDVVPDEEEEEEVNCMGVKGLM